jgi:glucokinase
LATEEVVDADGPPSVIAIDVGGTSIKGAVVGPGAELLANLRVATPDDSEHALVEAILSVGGELLHRAERNGSTPRAVGLSAAGVIDELRGCARCGANLRWDDTPLAARVHEGLGMPATLVQDARAAAHGEAIFGAGRGAVSFVSIILGTGVGSAVVIDGRPLRGSHGLAGEIGHLQVDRHGLECGCGGRGCVETLAAASALSRRYAAETGEALPAEGVLERVTRGDPVAIRIWSDATAALASAIAAVVAVVDCELVVLGGGMAAAGSLLLADLRRELSARVPPLAPAPRLAVAALGNAAGVFGAAAAALGLLGRGDLVDRWHTLSIAEVIAADPFGANGNIH